MGGAFVEFEPKWLDRPFLPGRKNKCLEILAIGAMQSWAFLLNWLWQPETKPNGLENRPNEWKNNQQDQENNKLGFGSHARVSLNWTWKRSQGYRLAQGFSIMDISLGPKPF